MHRQTQSVCAVILAALALTVACHNYDPDSYSPSEPPTLKALELEVEPASLPADGFSRAAVTARIDPAASPDRRTVVFTTTAGTFVGATEEQGRKISRAVDTTGEAQVQLQSSRVVQSAVVEASILSGTQPLVVQRKSIEFTAASPSDLIRISASSPSAPADGATVTRVFADIAPGLPAGQRMVTFTTSLGHFAGAAGAMAMTITATADSSNRATVDLIGPSDLTGQARVSATVADTTVQTTIDFVRALPEQIIVQPDKPALKASLQDSTTVTATLLRGSGRVTHGTVVSYRVVNADTGADLGFLIRSVSPSDAEGRSQAVVIAGNTTFRGIATIRASADGIVGEANIAIVDP